MASSAKSRQVYACHVRSDLVRMSNSHPVVVSGPPSQVPVLGLDPPPTRSGYDGGVVTTPGTPAGPRPPD